MASNNPKLLNLDEVELTESEITIRHEGADHTMRVLTVDLFIAQQKRADEHQKLLAAGVATEAGEVVQDAVEVIRDAIQEFFPTLPVGSLPTPKLFSIFAWLNELTAAINSAGVDDDVSAEGNVEELEETLTTEPTS